MSDDLRLNEAIETGVYLLPQIASELELLTVPGVMGRKTAVSHPLANTVGAAALDEKTAGETIRRVIRIYAADGLSFGWRVGPYSRPRDLGTRLLAAGLVRQESLAGLALTDLERPSQDCTGPAIREATPADAPLLEQIIRQSYPAHVGWAAILSRALLAPQSSSRRTIHTFLAYWAGVAEPVAMAAMYRFPDRPVVLLGGAATMEPYRRQGIYSCLVAHRLAVARRLGARAAVIQAVPESAHACRRLGFADFCEVEIYNWSPEEPHGAAE